jgi:hypothetical protein
MKKEFVNYNQALKLKAIGFDEPCFGFYLEDGTWTPASYSREGTVYPSNTDLLPEWCAAPLYQQAFRWFREKYQLQSEILWITDMNCFWYKTGKFKYSSRDLSKDDYKTYEEAELACLDKLIEIVEQNQQ